MKKLINSLFVFCLVCGSFSISPKKIHAQEVYNIQTINNFRNENFNENWKFSLISQVVTSKESANHEYAAIDFDDTNWRTLNLPHDWSIELDFNRRSKAQSEGGLLDGGIGWYRKNFNIDNVTDKNISITFDGVYMNSTVYVNGTAVGTYPYGYATFTYDISPYLKQGNNVIAVKVMNNQPSSRWYSGSGIYRDVHLHILDKVHVKENGTYITSENLEQEHTGVVNSTVKTIVENKSTEAAQVVVKTTPLTKEGAVAGKTVQSQVSIPENEELEVTQTIQVNAPELWSPQSPSTYRLLTEVMKDNTVIDRFITRYGYRYITWNGEGLYVNGEYTKMHGVSMHHDQGALGAVANKKAMERQYKIMKDMGVNAIRSTHNPADPKLVEIADEMGFILIDEAFDTWYRKKKTNDYANYFEQSAQNPVAKAGQTWAEVDLKAMINTAKNAPSVLMWSLGNEVYETADGTYSQNTAQKLRKWALEVDDITKTQRFITMGMNEMNNLDNRGTQNRVALGKQSLDAYGLNYAEESYARLRVENPNWPIYGSETSSGTRSRGYYFYPDNLSVRSNGSNPDPIGSQPNANLNYQQSDWGNFAVGWGKTATNAWIADRDNKGYAGQFIWTGFDYIGEPTPWWNQQQAGAPSKSSYFGVVDTAGYPKNDYYFYQSQWLNVNEKPMVHILPHWNWDENNPNRKFNFDSEGKIPVRIFSNARKVELFKDGVSLGAKTFVVKHTTDGREYQEGANPNELFLEWKIPYTPGKLEAKAYDKNGALVATDSIQTASESKKIILKPEKYVVDADGYDLSYIQVSSVDEHGIENPLANNEINFAIKGDGKIVGVDNGDAASLERYKAQPDGSYKRKLFSGKALVIVQSTKTAGKFELTATTDDLETATTTVYTKQPEKNTHEFLGIDLQSVNVLINSELHLPTEVTSIYADNTIQSVNVDWESLANENLQKVGTYTINGTVEGNPVKLDVNVIGYADVLATNLVITPNTEVTLPETVEVLYTNGTSKKMPVTWPQEARKATTYQEVKTYHFDGVVENTNLVAKLNVKVTDQYRYNHNVAPNATITGTHEQGSDVYTHINDENTARNSRWTSWQKGGISNQERNEIIFTWDELQEIKNLDIRFYTDFNTKLPKTVKIEYSTDGVTYKNLLDTNNQPLELTDLKKESNAIETLKTQVKTIKLILISKPKNDTQYSPVGLVEVKVYGKGALIANEVPIITQISVNNQSLADFSEDKLNYEHAVSFLDNVIAVSATGDETTSVQVIPFIINGENIVKIFATSEDGSKRKVYTIKEKRALPQLISAQITADKTNLDVDETATFTANVFVEGNTKLDEGLYNITYEVVGNDELKNEVENNVFKALYANTSVVKAMVTYEGKTIASNTVEITVNPTKNQAEIIAISPIKQTIGLNEEIVLPNNIVAKFNGDSFNKKVAVTWDTIPADLTNEYGLYRIEGTVENSDIKAVALIEVKGIIALETKTVSVLQNGIINYPAELKAYYSDGSEEKVAVTYNTVSTDKIGTFTVEGTVENTSLKAKLNVVVSNESIKGENIAHQTTGFIYPAAIANFTNYDDTVSHANDGIILVDRGSKNHWSNWTDTPRKNDWLGIVLAQGGIIQPFPINEIQVHFFEDRDLSYPETYKIQYFNQPNFPVLPEDLGYLAEEEDLIDNDEYWTDVTNLQAPETLNATAEGNVFKFDTVSTQAIRIVFTEIRSQKTGVGVTEMQIPEVKVLQKSTFDVKMPNVEHFMRENSEYANPNWKTFIPEVEVSNNAAVTIVPATQITQNTRVIIQSQDGKVSEEFNFKNIVHEIANTKYDNFHVVVKQEDLNLAYYDVNVEPTNLEKYADILPATIGSNTISYDISLLKNKELITEFDENIFFDVTIHTKPNTISKIYHIVDGILQEQQFTTDENGIHFSVNHFSPFLFVPVSEKIEQANTETENSTSNNDDNIKNSNIINDEITVNVSNTVTPQNVKQEGKNISKNTKTAKIETNDTTINMIIFALISIFGIILLRLKRK